MPDFTARFTAGVTLTVWDDHQAGAAPSRINPLIANASHFYKAAVGVAVTIKARVDLGGGSFVEGPADTDLGGRLFSSWFAEHASLFPVAPTGTAGSSSIQTFTPPTIGHYLWVLRRKDGGAIGLPFDAE
jgi:hypothetical protein